MTKIFVRERRHAGEGAGRPRFEIVAVQGDDLRFVLPHIRKAELEKIAADLSAEIVYLPRGEQAGEAGEGPGTGGGMGRGAGRGRRRRTTQD